MRLFDEEVGISSSSNPSNTVIEELADCELDQVGGGLAFPFIQT